MKSLRFFLILLACPIHAEWLPPAHELFGPLRADPRELQFALRLVGPVGHSALGETAAGDYLGIYRWDCGGGRVLQVSVGGGAFGRFDLSKKTNDMQTVDYFGNLPFDLRVRSWSFRFMPYHTSSHLGDDYLKTIGGVTEKHAWDNLKWLVSYEPVSSLRLYGGYDYVFRTLPGGIGRHAVQCGFETHSRWVSHNNAQLYWANDFQSWERAGWNPAFNSQAGITLRNKPEDARAVSIFVEYSAGRQAQGQFYLQKETRWTLGMQFHLT